MIYIKRILKRRFLHIALTALSLSATAQVWKADKGDGTYRNPILHADYSDPDLVRVGDDYYLTASSFSDIPGLPILHSKDLVNWQLIGHALLRQPPFEHFEKPQHGNGVWAPALRYRNGEFYLYYPDPDFGIYLVKAKNAAGPWSEPLLVKAGKGLIDPCPFWDDNGKAYLIHAFAGSRAGIKSILLINQLSTAGTKILDEGTLIFDGHDHHPTLEGPKVYKHNGYYYLSAPAGGVPTGYQLILRSKNIYGPYEEKIVLEQGKTPINGPHQGGWVDTPSGEWWFVHFQDKEAYGRILHLQPMKWVNNWPVMGNDPDGDGKGEPVLVYKKPNVGKQHPSVAPPESDEFSETQIGKQWQWHANPKATWAFASNQGYLRMFSYKLPDGFKNYWDVPNLLLQKFPAEEFSVTTKLTFNPRLEGEKVGFIIMGYDYGYLSLSKKGNDMALTYTTCKSSDKGTPETETPLISTAQKTIHFKVIVRKGAICQFAYSLDGEKFIPVPETFKATPGRWIGAKVGLFVTRSSQTNDSGFADIDYFRIEPLTN